MRKALTIVTLGLALSLGAALVSAQPRSPTADARNTKTLGIPEMKRGAGEAIKSMNKMLSDSFGLLEASIAAKDIATANARNEAITQMKALVKLSEQNHVTLLQKAAEADRDGVEHEYVKISIAAGKCNELFAQVKGASGVTSDLEMTDVERILDIDSLLPPPESIDFLPDPIAVPEPPIYASPYF